MVTLRSGRTTDSTTPSKKGCLECKHVLTCLGFLAELLLFLLWMPHNTPVTARNVGLCISRNVVYLGMSGAGYAVVETAKAQVEPERKTWLTSSVEDILGIGPSNCESLASKHRRQERARKAKAEGRGRRESPFGFLFDPVRSSEAQSTPDPRKDLATVEEAGLDHGTSTSPSDLEDTTDAPKGLENKQGRDEKILKEGPMFTEVKKKREELLVDNTPVATEVGADTEPTAEPGNAGERDGARTFKGEPNKNKQKGTMTEKPEPVPATTLKAFEPMLKVFEEGFEMNIEDEDDNSGPAGPGAQDSGKTSTNLSGSANSIETYLKKAFNYTQEPNQENFDTKDEPSTTDDSKSAPTAIPLDYESLGVAGGALVVILNLLSMAIGYNRGWKRGRKVVFDQVPENIELANMRTSSMNNFETVSLNSGSPAVA